MTKKIISKIVFIDTNIFINCALAETRDLNRVADINTLKDIKEKLDNKEMIIVLPENIKAEIITGMKIGFKKLEKYINDSFSKVNSYEKENKGKISMLIKEEIEKSKEDLIDKIIKKSKTISKIINEIIEHKNIKFIKLSNELILLGIKRSLLMKGPHTSQSSEIKNQKNAYSRDQDCIAFESFLNYLNKNKKELKKSECIICSDDSDYFKDSKKNVLHDNIIQEIKCKKLSGYKDILDMLEKEFGNKYSEKQIKEHKSSLDEMTQFLNTFSIDINKNSQGLYIDENILGGGYTPSLEDTIKNLTKPNMSSVLGNKLPSASDLLGKDTNQYIENLTLNPNRNKLGIGKNRYKRNRNLGVKEDKK